MMADRPSSRNPGCASGLDAVLRWLGVLTLATVLAPALWAARWKPITPEEMAADRPRVDPDAGVEALLRETEIDDSEAVASTGYHHYVRLKVFNQRGVEALDKIEILDTPRNPARDIAARVVKPDGEIIEIDRKAIYSREVLRRGSLRLRVKSFSFPALEPGCIVEYQWRETTDSGVSGVQLTFTGQFPAWNVRIRFRPFPYISSGYKLMVSSKNYDMAKPTPGRDDFYLFEQTNVPAARDEPWMLPDRETESAIIFYFVREEAEGPKFWKSYGELIGREWTREYRATREIKETARTVIGDATSDDEKLRRLYDHCRTKIRHYHRAMSGFTPEQLEKLKPNKTAADTLEHGYGSSYDINVLFLALASSAGFDVRFARAGDRNERFFDPNLTAYFMLPDTLAAVKTGDQWRFFDPGSTFSDFGSLSWQNEGVAVLVCDSRSSELLLTPTSEADFSLVRRTGTFTLDEDGTLEGDVVIVYGGHVGAGRKREFEGETVEASGKIVRDGVNRRLSAAELSEIGITNAEDPVGRFSISYHVRVPGYAERTGRRLLLQPSFFEKGSDAMFTAEKRDLDVYFPYTWSEEDRVEIKLPDNWTPEEGTAPQSLDGGRIADYKVQLALARSRNAIVYQRRFSVGALLVPAKIYDPLRAYLHGVHDQDHHTLVLKQNEAPAVAAP